MLRLINRGPNAPCIILCIRIGTCMRTCVCVRVYIIGRAGASPPSRTNSMIFLYIYLYIYLFIYIRSTVRRALNLLRASFSPIFQYFSAVNVTRVSFSPVFQFFVTYVYVYTLYIRMPCATELFDVRHGFFGPEGRVLNKGRRDSLSADLRIEKEQGRVADRRLRHKGS